jgi:hypothetical protein
VCRQIRVKRVNTRCVGSAEDLWQFQDYDRPTDDDHNTLLHDDQGMLTVTIIEDNHSNLLPMAGASARHLCQTAMNCPAHDFRLPIEFI